MNNNFLALDEIPPRRLIQAIGNCRTVYFCGLAKNTGKTVALRQAMLEAREECKRIAVTSIGRDGEAFDAIYHEFSKPLLFFKAGDLVVTSESLLPDRSMCKVVHRFGINSPIGTIVAARIQAPCQIEVAGPSTVSGLRLVRAWVLETDADLFLVDGALDRKAVSLPDICDGIVVSTGAALSNQIDDVLLQTRAAIEMLCLETEAAMDQGLRLQYSPVFDCQNELRNAIVASGESTVAVDIHGAVTERLIDFLMRENLFDRCRIIADCFAKVFISRNRWADYRRRGLKISYKRSVKLLSLTVNPISPSGPGFESRGFLESMRNTIPDAPVFDVGSIHYG